MPWQNASARTRTTVADMGSIRQLLDAVIKVALGCLVLLLLAMVGFQVFHFMTADGDFPGRPEGGT